MGSLGMAHGWGGIRKEAALELARAHWLYGRWLSATSLLNLGITQLQTFLVGGLLGLEAAGAFRAMFNLVQPMNQLTAAIALLFVADFSADFGAGRSEKLRAKGALITAGLAGLSILYELILILFGARLERLLYGGRFAAYAGLIPVLGLMPVFIALGSGCSLVLQAVQKPQHYLIRGAVIGPVGICSAVVLTSWAGLGGAAASTVITLALSALVTFWLYRRFGPVGGEVHT
jgi:O-antigen/teichoic acid export membrane protein